MNQTVKSVIIFAVGMVLFFIAGKVPEHVIRTRTKSLEHCWFWKVPINSVSPIVKGEYVNVPHSTTVIDYCSPCTLTKKVTCTEGDQLTVRDRKYYCNNTFICEAKPFSLKGEPLEYFQFSGKVPKNRLFISGISEHSYDSRYFGFVERKNVESIAIPIL